MRSMNNEKSETITLRRDEKRPLKFNGETLRTAIRKFAFEDDDGTKQAYEHEATLYRTETGKYVLEFTIYDETNEKWNCRYGWANADLKALREWFLGQRYSRRGFRGYRTRGAIRRADRLDVHL